MRTRIVEVKHVLFGQPPGMVFTQNKDVIEEFTPDTAQETLTHRVRLGCIGGRVDERDPSSIDGVVKQRTVLAVIIADQKTWTVAKRCRLSDLLCQPGITGRAGHIDMHHAPGAMLDDEEEKDLPEEQVIGLHKIARPDL